jgi:dihydrofolate reductase
MLEIIVACDKKSGIGCNNTLPWHFKTDLKHFAKTTQSKNDMPDTFRHLPKFMTMAKPNILIMGRHTFNSLPHKLPNRLHIVVTSRAKESNERNNYEDGIIFIDDLTKFITEIRDEYTRVKSGSLEDNVYLDATNKIFVIGGETLYDTCFTEFIDDISYLHLTHINAVFECDRFFRTKNDAVLQYQTCALVFIAGKPVKNINTFCDYCCLLLCVLCKSSNTSNGQFLFELFRYNSWSHIHRHQFLEK